MSTDKDTLVERDGLLYVRSVYPMYDEPKRQILYYPVSNGYGAQVRVDAYNREYLGQELSYNKVGCFYELDRGSMNGAIIIRLMNGGATQATFNELEEIACPKVRKGIETRFRNGRWEKCLKSQGWVSALY
jgi:hypothetical protein